jgi:hypothetical protein
VHLLNLKPTHPPSELFFLIFFFSTFLGVSRQGEFKNTINIFLQKVHVETFSQNFNENFDVCFSSTSFVLSRFRVFFSDRSSKTRQKTLYKKIVSKGFFKKFDQKPKTDFFSISFYHVFGRFLVMLVRGVQKDEKNVDKSDPGPFLAFDPPTHQGSPLFFLAAPWPGPLALSPESCLAPGAGLLMLMCNVCLRLFLGPLHRALTTPTAKALHIWQQPPGPDGHCSGCTRQWPAMAAHI